MRELSKITGKVISLTAFLFSVRRIPVPFGLENFKFFLENRTCTFPRLSWNKSLIRRFGLEQKKNYDEIFEHLRVKKESFTYRRIPIAIGRPVCTYKCVRFKRDTLSVISGKSADCLRRVHSGGRTRIRSENLRALFFSGDMEIIFPPGGVLAQILCSFLTSCYQTSLMVVIWTFNQPYRRGL